MNTRKSDFDPVRRQLLIGGAALAGVAAIAAFGLRRFGGTPALAADAPAPGPFEVTHTDAEWRALLSPEAYAVLRQQATERPFSSPLDHEKRVGTFSCAGCANPLFSSKTKFDSGTGWPSFWQPLPNAIGNENDTTLGMLRTEVHCGRCGGHLGHVFDDGPPPTGLRYCMNGVALAFKPDA
ncbi:MAG: peptide-methionine (R)-S-oxide reductase MsrB [Rhodanobacteraceae bacterium]